MPIKAHNPKGGHIVSFRLPHSRKATAAQSIPKLIHQTWKQPLHLPLLHSEKEYGNFGLKGFHKKAKASQASWRHHHPDYKYIFWSDELIEKFIFDNYNQFYAEWQSLSPKIKQIDSARYFILDSFGGIYADLDTICNKNITELLENQELVFI